MEHSGVRRLICQTTLGVGESMSNLNFFWRYVMFGWFLKDAFEDHVQQERVVTESKLDWTIVRPAAFTDGPLTGHYRHGFSGLDRNLTLKISRMDVAHFLLDQLDTDAYLRKAPGLSY
jgi:putative NADH-flavin reductase